jgi:hypothetical protein
VGKRGKLAFEIKQPTDARGVLHKRRTTAGMVEDPEKHHVRQGRRDDDIRQSTSESRQIGAQPLETVFTDDRNPLARL